MRICRVKDANLRADDLRPFRFEGGVGREFVLICRVVEEIPQDHVMVADGLGRQCAVFPVLPGAVELFAVVIRLCDLPRDLVKL
ncbi:MAG: hypothetical protein FWG31_03725 [Oscillospiraceae bacterium]|nr:hypothetical protein [Oscillospiraceae bacterium]